MIKVFKLALTFASAVVLISYNFRQPGTLDGNLIFVSLALLAASILGVVDIIMHGVKSYEEY